MISKGQRIVFLCVASAMAMALLFLPFRVDDAEGRQIGVRYAWFGDGGTPTESAGSYGNPLGEFLLRLDAGLWFYEFSVISVVGMIFFFALGGRVQSAPSQVGEVQAVDEAVGADSESRSRGQAR